MTESEKALSQFIAFANKHAPNKVDEITSAISVIKKVVDKATPIIPIEFTSTTGYYVTECPNCKWDVNYEYCPKCGQAIDWSES